MRKKWKKSKLSKALAKRAESKSRGGTGMTKPAVRYGSAGLKKTSPAEALRYVRAGNEKLRDKKRRKHPVVPRPAGSKHKLVDAVPYDDSKPRPPRKSSVSVSRIKPKKRRHPVIPRRGDLGDGAVVMKAVPYDDSKPRPPKKSAVHVSKIKAAGKPVGRTAGALSSRKSVRGSRGPTPANSAIARFVMSRSKRRRKKKYAKSR